MVGAAVQDYLKAIYKLSQDGRRCTPSLVAERLSVTPAAVTRMVKRLQELKLVNYARSQELSLTPAGEKIALEVIRHHRLLELYLKEALGYSWDEVHSEAEELEHVITQKFASRIDALLGHPTHDPHGDPIPTREGVMPGRPQVALHDLEPGEAAVIRRVQDEDPGVLRYLGDLGMYPNTPVRLLEKAPYGGPIRLEVDGVERSIGPDLARQVEVERAPGAGIPAAVADPG